MMLGTACPHIQRATSAGALTTKALWSCDNGTSALRQMNSQYDCEVKLRTNGNWARADAFSDSHISGRLQQQQYN